MSSFVGFLVGLWQTVLAVFGFAPEALPVTSFEECIDAGYSVTMTASLPGMAIDCTTPEGTVFPNPAYVSSVPGFQVMPDRLACSTDSDCVLSACDGVYSKRSSEYPRTGPSVCTDYSDVTAYKAACVTNKCTKVSRSDLRDTISVPGMSKYTDAEFGFSFWYPSGWTVQAVSTSNALVSDSNSGIVKILQVAANDGSDRVISISEFIAPSVTVAACTKACNQTIRYYFDASKHTWMMEYPKGLFSERGDGYVYQPGTTLAADVSKNTMGGLHMLSGAGGVFVIPLSARNFVEVSGNYVLSGIRGDTLAMTMIALDPDVAVPVPATEQIQVIRAAKDAYAQ